MQNLHTRKMNKKNQKKYKRRNSQKIKFLKKRVKSRNKIELMNLKK